jgi:hypothetical protein
MLAKASLALALVALWSCGVRSMSELLLCSNWMRAAMLVALVDAASSWLVVPMAAVLCFPLPSDVAAPGFRGTSRRVVLHITAVIWLALVLLAALYVRGQYAQLCAAGALCVAFPALCLSGRRRGKGHAYRLGCACEFVLFALYVAWREIK